MNSAHWIWTSPTWPALTFNEAALAPRLREARDASGRLFGKAEAVGASELLLVERDVWSGEAVATAAIEGETLPLESVRSSVARRLGIATDFAAAVPRNVEGLLDVMESAAAEWASDLTEERLGRWHAAVFPAEGTALRRIVTGRYRIHAGPMQIVSGPVGRETVHYEAPPSVAVRAEMRSFLDWFNRTRKEPLDGILRAGLAHVWFESIHPYEDGNGRIGRAIVDMAIAQDARAPTRLHGISSELRRRQTAYYDALNRAQRGSGEVTDWLAWFTDAFAAACRASAALIDESLVRARFWAEHRELALNERQRKVIHRMLEAGPGRFEGGLTQRKYVGLTGASPATAARDIGALVKGGLLVPGAGAARSAHYHLAIEGWEWKRR
ncbi:MAG: Fic family protein [Steroidobacteraceae bacterium]